MRGALTSNILTGMRYTKINLNNNTSIFICDLLLSSTSCFSWRHGSSCQRQTGGSWQLAGREVGGCEKLDKLVLPVLNSLSNMAFRPTKNL